MPVYYLLESTESVLVSARFERSSCVVGKQQHNCKEKVHLSYRYPKVLEHAQKPSAHFGSIFPVLFNFFL